VKDRTRYGVFIILLQGLIYNATHVLLRCAGLAHRVPEFAMNAPPVVPRPAATLIPVRDGAHGIEVFMLRRSESANFAPSAYVFPGGRVDAADRGADAAALCAEMDDVAASRELDIAEGGLAFRIGAIRECFEEAGLLFARGAHAGDELLAIDTPAAIAEFIDLRRRLNAGELAFTDLCHERGLQLACDRVVYFAHWITPMGLPRRFDTRFFIAVAPPAQTPLHDGNETVEHVWIAPGEAMARHQRGEFTLMFATGKTLELIGRHQDCAALIAEVGAKQKTGPQTPRLATGRAGPRVLGLDDFAYAEVGKLDPEGNGTAGYEIVPGTVTALSPKVRRVTAPNPGFMTGPGTNTYLLGAGDDVAVLDPGPAIDGHVRILLDAAAEAGAKIRWVLTTHTHMDHSPAAQLLKAETGAELIGMPPPAQERQDATFKPDRIPVHGERFIVAGCALRAIHTPGHASNHLCYLLEDEKMLFTGDHVMQGSTVVINPPDGDMRMYLASLRLLLEEDVEYFAPAHGFLIDRPRAAVEWLLAHRAQREKKIVDAMRATGEADIDVLVTVAYDDVPARVHPVASRSLLAHLLKLESDGLAAQSGGRWRLL
jgi:glyoxylase-like metal-dependent hydrolase (beta-lactamase superfamily II)/8-oxo-dGTP pyrophosphatase MutT (NUDIX family)